MHGSLTQTLPKASCEYPRRRESGIEENPLGETLIVADLEADCVHFLNASMAWIWNACDGQKTPAQLAEALVKIFDCQGVDEVEQLVEDALKSLASLELIH